MLVNDCRRGNYEVICLSKWHIFVLRVAFDIFVVCFYGGLNRLIDKVSSI